MGIQYRGRCSHCLTTSILETHDGIYGYCKRCINRGTLNPRNTLGEILAIPAIILIAYCFYQLLFK